MDTLRIEVALLRNLLPDLALREGMRFVASVAERAGQKGIIVLAGTPLTAQLPDDVRAGDVLRLVVTETSSERVVLQIVPQPAPAAPPTPMVGVPLPGFAAARITVDERDGDGAGGGDGDRHEVRLTYSSTVLGALQLHLALAGDAVVVNVRARAGVPFEHADRRRTELAEAIGAVTGKSAQVLVSARHDPFDAYA